MCSISTVNRPLLKSRRRLGSFQPANCRTMFCRATSCRAMSCCSPRPTGITRFGPTNNVLPASWPERGFACSMSTRWACGAPPRVAAIWPASLADCGAAATSPRQVAENLWVCSPLVLPWHSRAGVRALNERLLGWMLRRILNRLGFRNPLLWTYNPLMGPLLAKLPGSLVVYHCVDDLTAAPHMPTSTIETAEAELAQTADLVFTTSPRLQERHVRAPPPRHAFSAERCRLRAFFPGPNRQPRSGRSGPDPPSTDRFHRRSARTKWTSD